jgi:pimeloyl-ACP methyl ester carboxylesterase
MGGSINDSGPMTAAIADSVASDGVPGRNWTIGGDWNLDPDQWWRPGAHQYRTGEVTHYGDDGTNRELDYAVSSHNIAQHPVNRLAYGASDHHPVAIGGLRAGAEPVDLVAWSYGGLVTLDFALENPARVRTLTLIEPPATWVLEGQASDDPELADLLELAQTIGDDVTEEDLEAFVRLVALSPPGMAPQELPQWGMWMEHRRSLLSTTAPLDHLDDIDRLRAFDRPVLLVTGTGTSSFLRRIHDRLAAHLPHVSTVEMPAGHAPQLVSMDRFLSELERFHARAGRP